MSTAAEIPRFVVDLSQPPEERYAHIVPHFQGSDISCNINTVFNDLLKELLGQSFGKFMASVSPRILRRVYMPEENAELVGISKAMDVPMHALVAFNVLLDILLGCTSGGVRTLNLGDGPDQQSSRMLHFRTLDWGMDLLRQIIVELDFVRKPGGPVIATTVTYLGYVGVLTGVRKGLSMGLNFRPYHCRDTLRQRVSFRMHQVGVILGKRRSISSVLRGLLLDPTPGNDSPALDEPDTDTTVSEIEDCHMQDILKILSTSRSTAAYLVFCTPERVYVVEKDDRKSLVRDSDTFLTAFNHDGNDENDPTKLQHAAADLASGDDGTAMAALVDCSLERKDHLDSLWKKRVKKCQRRFGHQDPIITFRDILRFLQDDNILVDETHYAVIMDPGNGTMLWRRLYKAEESADDTSQDWNDDGEESVILTD
ncbi:NAAA-beta domain-containing protein [Fusarium sp. LHS14.1]|nr:NAAA-beta domain-containing protein [Fusarium sp. LHS14.1]